MRRGDFLLLPVDGPQLVLGPGRGGGRVAHGCAALRAVEAGGNRHHFARGCLAYNGQSELWHSNLQENLIFRPDPIDPRLAACRPFSSGSGRDWVVMS